MKTERRRRGRRKVVYGFMEDVEGIRSVGGTLWVRKDGRLVMERQVQEGH